MAEETLPKPSEPEVPAPATTEEAVEEPKAPEAAAAEKPPATEDAMEAAIEAAVSAEGEGVADTSTFKEETNVVAELQDPEKKALDELKALIQEALAKNEFSPPPPPPPALSPVAEEPAAAAPAAAGAAEEPAPAAAEAAGASEAPSKEAKVEEPEKAVVLEEAAAAALPEEVKTEKPAPLVEVAPPSEEKSVIIEGSAEEEATTTVEAIEETVVPVTAAEEEVAPAAEAEAPAPPPEEVFIFGVPLLGDERSDTVLLKFLRARDFKVKDALAMVKNAVIWRKQFGIESLVEEDLEIPELEKVVFNHGFDKEGHPVCYNVYGEFQNKDLYAKVFGDEEKREKFLRWRIQYLEKGIRQQLDFTPDAVSTMVQVTDLKNLPGPGKKELRLATKKALALLQDNYPEFVAKQVFINVPWWYLAYNRVISPFFTQRSKSKFVFAGPSKSADTLFKYIAPEQVPVQYGGLSKESDSDFSTADAVTEVTIKPASKHTVEIPATEGDVLVWELRVLGWEVSYTAEFVPSAEDGYTVIVHKERKFAPADEPYVKNSFKIGEPGKVVLTVDNTTSKKKKLLYRSKTKSAAETV
ncbi:patellin-3-like [Iris pallida]|uniref:Patellin-3-like n=1 Tax=Iris pallida TaxID=29817 RepID=A0AAX6E340_IRIPA|nr:patellin-3-like [Iris pallida]